MHAVDISQVNITVVANCTLVRNERTFSDGKLLLEHIKYVLPSAIAASKVSIGIQGISLVTYATMTAWQTVWCAFTEREREVGETGKQTDRQTDRQTRQTDRGRDRYRQTDRDGNRQKQKQKQRERESETDRQTKRHRHRQTETDRQG